MDPDAAFALSSSSSSTSPTPSPPRLAPRTLISSASSPGPAPGQTGDHGWRKGRWTAPEQAEVLRVGDAHAASGESWDALRLLLRGEARGRSAQALKARYALLVRDRRDRDRDAPGLPHPAQDFKVAASSSPARASNHSASTASTSLPTPSTSPLYTHAFPAAHSSPPSCAPPPWTDDEDATLLAVLTAPPLGPLTWPAVLALVQRVYTLGLGAGRTWSRSEGETRERWERTLKRVEYAPQSWPAYMVPALDTIHQRLTSALLAHLDMFNPALAGSMRAPPSAPVPAPMPTITLVPAPAQGAEAGAGRAAPPFPARTSPLPVAAALVAPHPAHGLVHAHTHADGDASAVRPFSVLPYANGNGNGNGSATGLHGQGVEPITLAALGRKRSLEDAAAGGGGGGGAGETPRSQGGPEWVKRPRVHGGAEGG